MGAAPLKLAAIAYEDRIIFRCTVPYGSGSIEARQWRDDVEVLFVVAPFLMGAAPLKHFAYLRHDS